MKVLVSADQIVFVAPVGVAGAVGVVLEDEDLPTNPLLLEPLLGPLYEPFEDSLSRLVVGDDIFDVVAFRSGELRMRADIEVEAGSVLQEDVGGPSPGDDTPEQLPSHFDGT